MTDSGPGDGPGEGDEHVFRFDPSEADPVVRSVDRRIRREAIRQLDSIDLDDDDDTIDPLPPLDTDALVDLSGGRGGPGPKPKSS